MLKEAIEKLCGMIDDSATPKLFDFGDCRNRHYVIGGVVLPIPAPLPSRVVYSLEDLIGYAKRIHDTLQPEVPMEIYYSASGVVLLPDAEDSRTKVSFSLTKSDRWKKLEAMAATPTPLDQRSFVRLLYADLYLDPALITPWRKMDFHAVSAISGEVARGRDRMGRDVTAQAVGADQLPETLPVSVPIYDVAGERQTYTLECRIDLDAASQRITLLPDPMQMHEIAEHHMATIASRLVEGLGDGVGVFFGSV